MAIIKFGNGKSVRFNGTPTQADIEEIASKFQDETPEIPDVPELKPPAPKPSMFSKLNALSDKPLYPFHQLGEQAVNIGENLFNVSPGTVARKFPKTYGMAEGVGQSLEALSTPKNIGIMGAMTLLPEASIPARAASGYFSYEMLKQDPELFRAYQEALKAGNQREASRLGTLLVTNSTMAMLGAKGAFKGKAATPVNAMPETQSWLTEQYLKENTPGITDPARLLESKDMTYAPPPPPSTPPGRPVDITNMAVRTAEPNPKPPGLAALGQNVPLLPAPETTYGEGFTAKSAISPQEQYLARLNAAFQEGVNQHMTRNALLGLTQNPERLALPRPGDAGGAIPLGMDMSEGAYFRDLVEKNGGQYLGIQGAGDMTPLVMFNDPTTKSTLAIPMDQVTPEKIKSKLSHTQSVFKEALGTGNEIDPLTARMIQTITGRSPELFRQRVRETADREAATKERAQLLKEQADERAAFKLPSETEISEMTAEILKSDVLKSISRSGKPFSTSSYPQWFKRVGTSREESLAILENLKSGKPLTERQSEIMRSMTENRRENMKVSDVEKQATVDETQGGTGSTEFNFGENVEEAAPTGTGPRRLNNKEIIQGYIPERNRMIEMTKDQMPNLNIADASKMSEQELIIERQKIIESLDQRFPGSKIKEYYRRKDLGKDWGPEGGAVLNPVGALSELYKIAKGSQSMKEFKQSIADNKDLLDTIRFYKMNVNEVYNKRDQGETIQKLAGKGVDIPMKETEIISPKKELTVKDVYGNTKTMPEGEAFKVKPLSNNQILLEDGQKIVVNKNQFQNIKGNSASDAATGKPFAPELAQIKETVKGKSINKNEPEMLNIEKELNKSKWKVSRNPGDEEVVAFMDPIGGDFVTSEEMYKYAIEDKDAELLKLSQLAKRYEDLFQKSHPADSIKYSDPDLNIPGGENPREILLQAPEEIANADRRTIGQIVKEKYGKEGINSGNIYQLNAEQHQEVMKEYNAAIDRADARERASFKSSHWKEPNVIAHIRMNDRTTADGKKVSFMEEAQSDWAREGRQKGFIENKKITELPEGSRIDKMGFGDKYSVWGPQGDVIISHQPNPETAKIEAIKRLNEAWYDKIKGKVPNHPLLKKWQELAVKRALKDAVDSGAEYLSWTTGAQQADRYDLSKHLESVEYRRTPGNEYVISMKLKGGRMERVPDLVPESKLAETVGKELAQKIIDSKEVKKMYSGLDLKVGGEWAQNLYDKQIPNILKDITGGKIETINIGKDNVSEAFRANLTDEAKPLFDKMTKQNKTQGEIIDRLSEEFPDGWNLGGDLRELTNPKYQQAIRITPEIRRMVKGDTGEKSQEFMMEEKYKYIVSFKGKNYPVSSLKEASEKYRSAIKQANIGASETGGHPLILDKDGNVVGHLAYNGKVFPGTNWESGTKPLYNPFDETMRGGVSLELLNLPVDVARKVYQSARDSKTAQEFRDKILADPNLAKYANNPDFKFNSIFKEAQETSSTAGDKRQTETGQPPKPTPQPAKETAPSGLRYVDDKALKINIMKDPKATAEDIRNAFSSGENLQKAKANYLAEDVKKIVPNQTQREGLYLLRDMISGSGSIQEAVAKLGQYARDPRLKAYKAQIEAAMSPTKEMLTAKSQLDQYYKETGQVGQKYGFLDEVLESYGNRLYKPKPPMTNVKVEGGQGLRRSTSHAQHRVYPNILEAILNGEKPATLDPTDAVIIHGAEFSKVLMSNKLEQSLKDVGLSMKVTDDPAKLADPYYTKRPPKGWVKMDRSNTLVPDWLAPGLQAITDQDYIGKYEAMRRIQEYQGGVKTINLSVSLFHHFTLGMENLSQQNPEGLNFKAMYDKTMGLESESFRELEKHFISRGGETTNVDANIDIMMKLREGNTWLSKIMASPKMKIPMEIIRKNNDFLFGKIQRWSKVTNYAKEASSWIYHHPNATEQEATAAQRSIAREVNASFGGLNWKALGKTPSFVRMGRLLFLALDWTYSNYDLLKVGITDKGPGGHLARRNILTGFLAATAMSQAMNQVINGRYTWQNEKGHEFEVEVRPNVYLSFYRGGIGDILNWARKVFSLGPIVGTTSFAQGKFAPFIRTGIALGSNRNFYGSAIVKKDSGPLSGTAQTLNYLAQSAAPVPFGVGAMEDLARKGNEDPVSFLLAAAGLARGATPKKSKFTGVRY